LTWQTIEDLESGEVFPEPLQPKVAAGVEVLKGLGLSKECLKNGAAFRRWEKIVQNAGMTKAVMSRTDKHLQWICKGIVKRLEP